MLNAEGIWDYICVNIVLDNGNDNLLLILYRRDILFAISMDFILFRMHRKSYIGYEPVYFLAFAIFTLPS